MSINDLIYELFKFIDIYGIIILAFLLINYIIISISLYFIYRKIGIKEKKALVPIYNLIVLLDIVSLPKFLIILIVVPYVNILGSIIMSFIIGNRLSKVFKQKIFMKLGLMILPIVFIPLLSKKNLSYKRIEEKETIVKENDDKPKDFTLDVPKYEVDLSSIGELTVLSANELNNQGIKNVTNQEVKENIDDVANITFDYNELYNIEDKSVEGVNNMNQEKTFEEQIPVPIELSIDLTGENNGVNDVVSSETMNVSSAPMAPMVEPQEVVTSIPEVVETVVDLPSAPVAPTIEPQEVVTSIPEIAEPVMEIPSAPVAPTIEPQEVVTSIPEVAEPVVDLPSAPVAPTIEPQEVVTSIPEVVEPEVDLPSAPVAPTIEPQEVVTSIPEVVEPVVDLPSAPVAPTIEPQEVVTSIPEVVEPVVDLPSAPVVETIVDTNVVPTTPVEVVSTPVESMKIKPTTEAIDYNLLYNIEKQEDVAQKFEEQKQEQKKEAYDALNMAAPPAFEIPTVEEEVVEEKVEVHEIKKEDLVSVTIDEPEALPVVNLNINNVPKQQMTVENLMGVNSIPLPPKGPQVVGGVPQISNFNNLPPGYSECANPALMPQSQPMMQQPMMQQPMMNGQVASAGYPPMSPQGMVPPQPMNNGPMMNGQMPMVSNGNTQMAPQGMMQQGYPEQPMNIQSSGLLRKNEDTRSFENSMKGPNSSKFITNDENKYTLPKEEKPVVQMPTDPNLLANPMAIFGSSASVIRPTAAEAMQQSNQQPPQPMVGMPQGMMQQGYPGQPMMNGQIPGMVNQEQMANKCPNCGFVVKPGQPTCVVCGSRLM